MIDTKPDIVLVLQLLANSTLLTTLNGKSTYLGTVRVTHIVLIDQTTTTATTTTTMYTNSQWTNDEASRTKLALSKMGYLDDKFIGYFCGSQLKRTPEINRGYYYRVSSVAHVVQQFCRAEGAAAQIVNVGAGYDTLFWRFAWSFEKAIV